MQKQLSTALAHYVQLAKSPGWREYVWHQVKTMAASEPAVYGQLPALLVAAMKEGNK